MYCFLTHVIIPSGIGFKLAYKFTALIDIILQENFGTKKIILKQYLQYLYKIKVPQIFVSFGFKEEY